jgi:hypothetical protein
MMRSVVRARLIGLSVMALALAACGGGSGTGDGGGQKGGSGGGGGGQTGTGGTTGVGGTTGSGGQGGGECAACAAATVESCPADVATADMCPSPNHTCCAGLVQWTCGLCLAETCHWIHSCTTTGGTGGGGGSGGTGGGSGGAGGGNAGTGGGGGSAASDCSACDSATQFCHVTVGGAVGNPPSYQCMALPSACATTPTCACLQGKVGCGNLCSMGDGGVMVTCQAP